MMIPCIDLQDGRAVQLVHGRERKLAVDDVFGLLDRFGKYPLIHVIDLDAAMRKGSNAKLVRGLCAAAKKRKMRVRVGGGIRTVAQAAKIASYGAEKIIVGSAAFKNGRINAAFLARLSKKIGRRRVMVALDTEGGKILVRGWQEKLRLRPGEVIAELEKYAYAFLCTYVDAEGTMRGTNLPWFRKLRRATRLPITAAGGIRSRAEIRALDRIQMDAAVGMALYTGKLS
ncbi:MAG: 1-(5-phosphoribosyl)-5-[(5-phosphoribosylamino)methylideneamino] imidazole-4-carboxamide isomerase [Acidobacteriia bacterium]|nr:1-(5-phosphoribosyl)-5-[(5-phosphoribosylamino)methylideneamino] imidazole-4-carboxamide isomerase [Terriglobia bacterium]